MFALGLCSVRPGVRLMSTSAADAAARILDENAGRSILRSQLIDAAQVQRLSLTLGRAKLHPALSVLDSPPPTGTPLPPGYHLAYFTPAALESSLGSDGTDTTFNPVEPFVRRMWAGGSMTWTQDNPLRVGDIAEERTTFVGAAAKKSRSGHKMVFVEVEKAFSNSGGISLVDKRYVALPPWIARISLTDRSWIFQAAKPPARDQSGTRPASYDQTVSPLQSRVEDLAPEDDGLLRRSFRWSAVGLFRFSALTFNAHMIHYSNPWSTEVENLAGLVVHGPLNLINMLDFWRDVYSKGDISTPSKISYRAVAPLYVGDEYTISAESASHDCQASIVVSRVDGTVHMTGMISSI